MVRRVRSDDLELMATAHCDPAPGRRQPGRDSRLHRVHHSRAVRIKGEIRTLTAQQRLSGYVVQALPICLMGLLFVIAPRLHAADVRKPARIAGLPAGMIVLGVGGSSCSSGSCIRRHRLHRGLKWSGDCWSHGRRRHPVLIIGLASGSPVDPGSGKAYQLGSIQLETRGTRAPAALHGPHAAALRRAPSRMGSASAARPRQTAPRDDWPWPATPATCGLRTGSA